MTQLLNPFSAMVDSMMESAIAEQVDFQFADGSGIIEGISALITRPDQEGDFDQVRVSQDARRIEIKIADLVVEPTRGDTIVRAASCETFVVQSKPQKDDLRVLWLIDAYLKSE